MPSRPLSTDLPHLVQVREVLNSRRTRVLAAFTRATQRADRARMLKLSQHLEQTAEVLNWLDQIDQDVQAHVRPDPRPTWSARCFCTTASAS